MFLYMRLMCLLWFVRGINILRYIKSIKKYKRIFEALNNPNNKKEGIIIKLLLPQWFIFSWYSKIFNEKNKYLHDNKLKDTIDIVWNALNEKNKKLFMKKGMHN